ncbi:PIG-L family deacetylase [Streptomyces sp. RLB1-33]|uniref:PIG-L deacetylase family protein n=1 Tax=Streptomyces mirabilis TaxID=68239 RepID=UPI00143E7632|nr:MULTISPECIES: PIG-L family deacetylase [Streptomyces]QIY69424.1 GlcNAc-PI de-N-acetylase [Streptomyces sp. RLB1-33]QUW83729.1 PIG-L family deacetylase [Streptomyces mirabilis]
MTAPKTRRPTLMVVHAHPDDEASQTGGTLARYAAAGVRTVVVTCTDGAQGDGADSSKPGDRDHEPAQVAARRSRELAESGAALGISDLVRLDHPDSGVPDSADDIDPHAFSRMEGEPVVRRLEALMREYRPDVIVTYPPNGFSNHPDHVRTHELTVAAFERIKRSGGLHPHNDHSDQNEEGGPHPRSLPKLYYIAVSLSSLKAVRALAEAALGPDAWITPLYVAVDTVTAAVDVSEFWPHKLRALAAHASQADAAALLRLFSVPGDEGRVEEYLRAHPPWTGGTRESDLFEGARETP